MVIVLALLIAQSAYSNSIEIQVLQPGGSPEAGSITSGGATGAAVSPSGARAEQPPGGPRTQPNKQSPANSGQGQQNKSQPSAPQSQQPPAPQYSTGAGPTGTNYDTSGGTSSGATIGTFDMNASGLCGPAQDMWRAAANVMHKGTISPGKGYDIDSANWPKLSAAGDSCNFGGSSKTSMCTSATAAAFCEHISSLMSQGLRLPTENRPVTARFSKKSKAAGSVIGRPTPAPTVSVCSVKISRL